MTEPKPTAGEPAAEPTAAPEGALQFDRVEIDEAGMPTAGPPGAPTPEPEVAAVPDCTRCRQPIAEAYYEIDGQVMCDRCRAAEVEWRTGGSRLGRVARATVLGLLAGAVGAAIYYAVLALTGYEVGLISIAVGFLVGIAVNFGAHRRGGWFYQLLAVGITYCAIVSTYVPGMLEMLREIPLDEPVAEQAVDAPAGEAPAGVPSTAAEPPVTGLFLDPDAEPQGAAAAAEEATAEPDSQDPAAGEPPAAEPPAAEPPAAEPPAFEPEFDQPSAEELRAAEDVFRLVMALALAFVAPVLLVFIGGLGGILGLLIVGFGLWEAWRLNRRQPFEVAGPFRLGPPVAEP